MNDDLPLLELFTRLQQSGFPLGIAEYQAVLQALQGGFGIGSRTALARLCCSLWVKSAEEEQIFNYHFEQLIGSLKVASSDRQTPTFIKDKPRRLYPLSQRWLKLLLTLAAIVVLGVSGVVFVSRFFSPPEPQPNRNVVLIVTGLGLAAITSGMLWLIENRDHIKQKQGNTPSKPKPSPPLSSGLSEELEDEVQIAQAVRQMTRSRNDLPNQRFLASSEFFPITRRQIKQNWRYLRRLVREGPATELDIGATINQWGRQGAFLNPVLIPRRHNRIELLLLIDQDGSMVPFHTLSSRLIETAAREGRLGKTGAYYFHNCPIDYLYHEPYLTTAKPLSTVLAQLNPMKSVALIVSDAGAARGHFNPERLELTQAFLQLLQQHIPHIVWLNPVPQARWRRSTAGAITQLVPMFELTKQGMNGAIAVLRGRYSPLQKILRL
ncbi:hypothetical protein U2F10_31635 [Leptothoe sp. EHU-05/26/07-4]